MNKKLGRLICGMALWLGWTTWVQAQLPAPEPLVITETTGNSISLAWNDIYENEDGFKLTRTDGWGAVTNTFLFEANVTSYRDTNLLMGNTYFYQVVAFNSGGESYPAFNSAAAIPIPAPEPLLITGVTANTIGLAWNDIYDDEDGFRLTRTDYWGNQAIFQFGANVTTFLDTNLIRDMTYYYMVAAFNSGGESYPAFNSAVTRPIPAPEPLLITGVTANTIGLAWNDIYNNEDGFRVTRSDYWGNQAIFQFGPNVTTFLDTNLMNGMTYYYMVMAFNSGGESYPAFNSAVATPIPAPEPLLITGVTANTIALTWNDIYNNEDGFRLTRRDYWGNVAIFQLGANVTSYLDTNLMNGMTYYYMVAAFNSGGESYPAFNSAVATPIPAPEPLLITGVTANTIALTWNDIYNNEDGFRLTRRDYWGNVAIFEFGPNVTSCLDTNLMIGMTYYYMVAAFNSGGESYPAFNSAVTTPIPGPAPLVISGVTANTVSLAWNDIYENEDGFRLTRTDFFGNQAIFQFGANVTTFLDTNLSTGMTYYYYVVAFNSGGESYPAFNSAVPTPIPGPEPLLITGVTANTVRLAWNDIYENEDGFFLTRWDGLGNQQGFQFAPNVTTYTDTNLLTGNTYYYQVIAFNSGGESAPAFNSATPAPSAGPEPLIITGVTASSVGLSWSDIYTNEDGFRIERSTNGFDFPLAAIVDPNTTNYNDSGLNPQSTYFYRVAAFNSGGDSLYATTNATTLPNPPLAPSGVIAMAVSQTEINLTWTDNSSDETGFQIERSTDGSNFVPVSTVGANAVSFADTGLTAATLYYYRVSAFNSGGYSAPSSVASATTPDYIPVAPSTLVATTASATQINLTWVDNANNETGFKVYTSTDGIDFSLLATLAANVTSYPNTGLTAATAYYYRVTAFNSGGESAYAANSATTLPNPPLAPSDVIATAASQTEINLTWTDNSGNETGFQIERSTDGSNFSPVSTVGANAVSFADTGLTAATLYYYRVSAFNSGGVSAYAANSATTLPNPPLAPSGVIATAASQTEINVTWTDNSANETGFQIERSTDGSSFSPVSTVGANAVSFADTGLTAATLYYYRVSAFNSGGYSSPSSVASATTPDYIPVAPSTLVATTASATQINLTWVDNANNETGFKVYISTDGINFSLLTNLAANITAHPSTGLTPATAYYYRVTAFNSGGESAYAANSATTLPNPPLAPSGVIATAASQTEINVTWTDNSSNETGFQIERSTDGSNFSPVSTVGANAVSFADTGLSAATLYYYRVSAFNSGGYSAPSSVASATTPDYIPVAPSTLVATTASATQINLTWVDNANNETGFKVYISTNGINFSLLTNLAANITAHPSTGLTPATAYYYRVTASNATGESAASNVASATTLDVPPAAPSGLSATAVSSNRVNLSWADNAGNESGFAIERSTNGVNYAQIATVGANVTTYTNTGLAASTTYHYRVRATNSVGSSAFSSSASATTGPAAPPAAPSNLNLTVVSSTQINLQWNDNSSTETQFLIERSLNGSTFTQIAAVSANTTTYPATGLQPNTRYYFRVRATNSVGNSAYSNTANAKTLKN